MSEFKNEQNKSETSVLGLTPESTKMDAVKAFIQLKTDLESKIKQGNMTEKEMKEAEEKLIAGSEECLKILNINNNCGSCCGDDACCAEDQCCGDECECCDEDQCCGDECGCCDEDGCSNDGRERCEGNGCCGDDCDEDEDKCCNEKNCACCDDECDNEKECNEDVAINAA